MARDEGLYHSVEPVELVMSRWRSIDFRSGLQRLGTTGPRRCSSVGYGRRTRDRLRERAVGVLVY
jgi:hypothetical protein